MFCSRKSSHLIRQSFLDKRLGITRSFSNQSESSASSSSPLYSSSSSSPLKLFFGGGRNGRKKSSYKLSWRSGVVAAGSSLGFWCWSSSNSPFDENSYLCFADSPNNKTWAGEDEDQNSIPEKKPKFLFGDAYRRRIFFNYEKRIRTQSPPEKVFEYFASFKSPSGEVLMTPPDLMRAIVPVFPPSESNRVREGSLRGERVPSELTCPPSNFFMLFDTNNDGLVSFPEYIFFVTLLSIPESSFSVAFKMFDLDNNGEIDREEFKKVMTLMRSQNRQGAYHRGGQRVWFKTVEPVENGGLVEYFFGKDGKTFLQHERFVQFLRELHVEILHLEFAHYDYKLCGTISGKDFALSLVASADISHINKFLDRVEEITNKPQLADIRITFQEFKDFAELRKKLQSFSLALFSYGKVNGVLTKKDFQRAASQVCDISLTNNVIDVIFHVFDANNDGNLSADEFVKVVQRREKDPLSQAREPGVKGLVSCWFNCATKCPNTSKLFF